MENAYIPEISKSRNVIGGFEVRPFVSYYNNFSSFLSYQVVSAII